MALLTVLLRIVGMAIVYAMYVLLVRYLILGYSFKADMHSMSNTLWRWTYRYEQPIDVTLRRLSALRNAIEQGKFSDDTGIVEGQYRDVNEYWDGEGGADSGSN